MVISLDNVRSWPFHPIIIPINKDGQGPCTDEEAVKITWEVWSFNTAYSFGPYENLPDAINKAIELSKDFFNLPIEEASELYRKREEEGLYNQ